MQRSHGGRHGYAVIPARSGSKGVRDKNIRLLAGHPLLAWSVRAAALARCIDRVLVSTDSAEYAELAISYGAEAPFLRPPEISGDMATDLDVMRHLVGWLRQEGRPLPDFLIHLRPTTPLRDPAVIDSAVLRLADDSGATALRSVHEMAETAYKCVERDGDYLTTVFTREPDLEAANGPRQGFPPTYVPNGYVDVLRSELIFARGRLHGDRVLGLVTPPAREVDCQEDFEFLEFEASRRPDAVYVLFGKSDVQLSHQ